jgi:hypothetical protein
MSIRYRSCGLLAAAGLAAIACSGASAQPAERPRVVVTPQPAWLSAPYERLVRAYAASGRKLSRFWSDGCSAGLSQGWRMAALANPFLARNSTGGPPFEHCCVEHDRVYHSAARDHPNPQASMRARALADEALRQCVKRSGFEVKRNIEATTGISANATALSYGFLGEVMQGAVSAAGGPCTGASWRWGNGSAQC